MVVINQGVNLIIKMGKLSLPKIVGAIGIGALVGYATFPLIKNENRKEPTSLENKVAIVAQAPRPEYTSSAQKQIQKASEEVKKQFENAVAPEKAPEFNVPSGFCSRYIRLAAKRLYGIDIVPADAWNLEDYYKTRKIPLKNLDDFVDTYNLEPGIVIGVFNPKSRYNGRRDNKGNKVDYTHVILYTGKDKWGKPIFIHQFGRDTRRNTLNNLKDKGLTPREIIYTTGR